MKFRIVIDGKQAGERFSRIMSRNTEAARKSLRQATVEVGDKVQEEGRSDIAAAGNFGTNWTNAWKYRITEGGGHIKLEMLMGGPPPVSFWKVFQEGRVINGRPMLWIPLSFASDAKGVSARDYPGPLFRVNRPGKAPLLLTTGGEPKYFGKESVTIPKKFHLVEIARRGAKSIGKIYTRLFKENRRG